MPRVCFPVVWSSLRTTETSAPRATSLRFRPSMKLASFTASSKSFGVDITIILGDDKIIPASEGSTGTLVAVPVVHAPDFLVRVAASHGHCGCDRGFFLRCRTTVELSPGRSVKR